MFVINRDAVSRARQMFPAHRAGRAATHNRNITHQTASIKRQSLARSPALVTWFHHDSGNTAAMNHAASIAENIAAAATDSVCPCNELESVRCHSAGGLQPTKCAPANILVALVQRPPCSLCLSSVSSVLNSEKRCQLNRSMQHHLL